MSHFAIDRSGWSVLKWNAQVSVQNDPAHALEPFSSPAPVGQSAEIWRIVAGKNVRARLGLFISTGQNQFLSAGHYGKSVERKKEKYRRIEIVRRDKKSCDENKKP